MSDETNKKTSDEDTAPETVTNDPETPIDEADGTDAATAEELADAASADTSSETASADTNSETADTPAGGRAELQELRNRNLRLQADFDNLKRRTAKEKQDIRKHVHEELLAAMLPAFDDLDRSMKVAETAEDLETLRQGIRSAHKKFQNAIQKQGVAQIEVAKGGEFNEDLHDAIATMPTDDEALKGKIVEVVENGYELNGKVLRYAKVLIGE